MRIQTIATCMALGTMIGTGIAQAEAPAELAALLGAGPDTPLTPNGAIKAGNADGTIPAWEGGIAQPPPGYAPTDGSWPYVDPYGADKPLFTITAQNYQQYTGRLSEGQQKLFQRYPDTYKMDVYPTRRSWSAPPFIYEQNANNAVEVNLSKVGLDPENYWGGTCFPIPRNGAEARLNTSFYRCMWATSGDESWENVTAVDPNGSWQTAHLQEWHVYPQYAPSVKPGEATPYFKFLQITRAPARLAGTNTLFMTDVSYERQGWKEKAWQYNPGQRRVRRAPQIQYDFPKNGSNGMTTVDQAYCAGQGNIDRYTWQLEGRREMFIPYNTYKLADRNLKEADIVQRGHPNQELIRYELHRVWKLVGNQKSEYKMAVDKRVRYLDEDSWWTVLADYYDKTGGLFRFFECATMNYYNYPLFYRNMAFNYDISSSGYTIDGMNHEPPSRPREFGLTFPDNMYTVGYLKGTGVR